MIILLDVDDVIADLVPAWLKQYNYLYMDDLKIEQITGWDIASYTKPECSREKFFGILEDGSIYENVRPIQGAQYGIQELQKKHDVYFVTAGYYKTKREWLKGYGLLMDDTEFIVCYDKNLIRGDILIDDRFDNIEKFPGKGILFTRPWNEKFRWPYIADTWVQILPW